uniref:Uncharacterized protein n=1 Tax=Anguilla anguilla TaxID=7936 RepID=A0A0E9VHF4_ANGAN
MLYILSNFGPWLLVICSVLQMKHLVHTHFVLCPGKSYCTYFELDITFN